MRERIGTIVSAMLVILPGVGCGGDPMAGSVPPPPPPAPTLDYHRIAGQWVGSMSTPGGSSSSMEVFLNTGASLRGKIGTVSYGQWNCGMDLHALEAAPPDYVVEERYASGPTNCAEGLGILEHDPQAETLVYTFVNHDDSNDTGTATLTRE